MAHVVLKIYILMLTFNFTRIFRWRGIEKPYSFLVDKGYSKNISTRIVNNRIERLNLKDIEKLCELFCCTPNDLLEWVPGKKDVDIENHPLKSLQRSNKALYLSQLLNTVPMDKLDEVEKIIKQEIEKLNPDQ
jgi:DNA-binding Xre family transcriptional regulator